MTQSQAISSFSSFQGNSVLNPEGQLLAKKLMDPIAFEKTLSQESLNAPPSPKKTNKFKRMSTQFIASLQKK